MSGPTRATAGGRAYRDLQNLARADGRSTEELLALYALEGFLARLSRSDRSQDLVLKAGALLAAYGTRRPTRDIDLSARAVSNDAGTVLDLVREIASIAVDDGIGYDVHGACAETIRDGDEYSGVRVTLGCSVATARLRFHVDVNVGDPIWPLPGPVDVPRLLGGCVTVLGYPLTMVLAEKLVTAIERGTANTRWRDYADVYLLTGERSGWSGSRAADPGTTGELTPTCTRPDCGCPKLPHRVEHVHRDQTAAGQRHQVAVLRLKGAALRSRLRPGATLVWDDPSQGRTRGFVIIRGLLTLVGLGPAPDAKDLASVRGCARTEGVPAENYIHTGRSLVDGVD